MAYERVGGIRFCGNKIERLDNEGHISREVWFLDLLVVVE
jgi:hypothetical protein